MIKIGYTISYRGVQGVDLFTPAEEAVRALKWIWGKARRLDGLAFAFTGQVTRSFWPLVISPSAIPPGFLSIHLVFQAVHPIG